MNKVTYEGKKRYQDDSIADDYDNRRFISLKGRLTNRLEKYWINKALKSAIKSGRILDLPCGTGRMTEMFLENGFEVTGGDISDSMMKHAKARTEKYGNQVVFSVCDIEKLEFPEESFDLILTMRLIHHIPSSLHLKVLSELHRTTKRWVIISFSSKYSIQNFRRNLVSLFTKFPRYSISPSLFKKEVRQAGFKIHKYYRIFPVLSETVILLLEKDGNT